MAAVMGVDKVTELLSEAAGRGCSLVWLEGGALAVGADMGRPQYVVDFVTERLRKERRREAKTDLAVGPHPAAANQDLMDSPGLVEVQPFGVHGRRTGNLALVLEGEITPVRSYKELLCAGLQMIERVRSGTLEKLSAEKGRTKRVVARRPDLLYENSQLTKHAIRIEGDWWVATNNNRWEVEKYLRRAAFHAGLHVEIRH